MHPVGVAPKAPSNFLKLLGVFCDMGFICLDFTCVRRPARLGVLI